MKPYKLTLPAITGGSLTVVNESDRPLIVEEPGHGTAEVRAGRCVQTPIDGPPPQIRDVWLPIGSAPRDGDPIDLWCGNRRIPDCTWEITGTIRPAGYEGTEGWRSESRDYETREKPTHWMPTPKGPV